MPDLLPITTKTFICMDILKNIGFSPDQIAVYRILMEYGKLPASVVAGRSKVSRVITYKILGQFVDMGIAEKIEAPKSVAMFGPLDPEQLRKLIDHKQSEVASFKNACETAIATLRPQFNLLNDKPGVVFYEGLEGVKKVLEDSLYTESTIYTYVDVEAVLDHFKTINANYVTKREKQGIAKKLLVADTPRTREYLGEHINELTDMKMVGKEKIPFGCAMQIYDNKISYITIGEKEGTLVGVIIEDKHIADMHKYFFECLYDAS